MIKRIAELIQAKEMFKDSTYCKCGGEFSCYGAVHIHLLHKSYTQIYLLFSLFVDYQVHKVPVGVPHLPATQDTPKSVHMAGPIDSHRRVKHAATEDCQTVPVSVVPGVL